MMSDHAKIIRDALDACWCRDEYSSSALPSLDALEAQLAEAKGLLQKVADSLTGNVLDEIEDFLERTK